MVTAEIGGRPYQLGLDLVSKHPLWLADEVLEEIPKTFKGEGSFKDIKGEEHWASLFEVPHVKLGSLDLKRLRMSSKQPIALHSAGSIAWPFDKMNLLLDFPHCRAWGVSSQRSLTKLGFDLSRMEKVPCKVTKKGIYVNANTPLDALKLLLSTRVNQNIIATQRVGPENECCWIETQLGSRSFGENRFVPYQIAPELEAEGVLGVRFLLNHVVYIDARHEMLYIGEKYQNTLSINKLVKVPLEFTIDGLPIMQVQVDRKPHHVLLDTGSDQELSLLAKDFSTISLHCLGSDKITNMLGETSEVYHYLLPECRIQGVALKQVVVSRREEIPIAWLDLALDERGTFDGDWGILGRGLLHKTNLYFDFPNAVVWFVKTRDMLKKVGVDWTEYVPVPFEPASGGIVLRVDTDIGGLKMILDTGAPTSVIHSSLAENSTLTLDEWGNTCIQSDSLVVGGHDYGRQPLYPVTLDERFDGVLGMDFLRDHPFYIDYENRVLYFGKSHPG